MKTESVRVELALSLSMLYLLAYKSGGFVFYELSSIRLLAILVVAIFATTKHARQALLGDGL